MHHLVMKLGSTRSYRTKCMYTATTCGVVDAVGRLNEDVSCIIAWALSNKLLLYPDKTQATIYGSAKFINTLHTEILSSVIVDDNAIGYSR